MTSYNFGEITNYTETIRTNVNFNTVGLQTLYLELDNKCIPQSYVEDRLEFYGNGYAETNWIPELDPTHELVEIEISQPRIAQSAYNKFLQMGQNSGASVVEISQASKTDGTLRYRDSVDSYAFTSSNWSDNKMFIALFCRGGISYICINGVLVKSNAQIAYTSSPSVKLGSNSSSITDLIKEASINHFKVVTDKSVIDNYNPLAEYNKWLLKTQAVLTDDNGSYLTDANGVYIYI